MANASSFTDGWVIDRTLFDHARLGNRDCCGGCISMMASSPLMLELCTDLDTDDRRKDALAHFPPCMKAEIDRDRLAIRLQLKNALPRYQSFVGSSLTRFAAWWATVPLARKQSICVMPMAEVAVLYATQLDMRGAYNTVSQPKPHKSATDMQFSNLNHHYNHQLLVALLEQVRHFQETGYAHDGAIEPEVAFERALTVKRGALGLTPEYLQSATGFRELLGFIGGPKLLLPHSKRRTEESTSASASIITSSKTATSCFRGDRRLIRLVVARYLVDRAIRQFEKAAAEHQKG